MSDEPDPKTDIDSNLDDPVNWEDTSPYNPDKYNCQGYGDEEYEYFDGLPGPGKDHRFTIDLEHGSMDRSVQYICVKADSVVSET